MRLLFVLSSTLLACASIAAPIQVVLDGSAPGGIFQGVGATSGNGPTTRLLFDYPQPQRNEILDYLFKPHYGASLQQLKVEIGSDANSTQGSELTYARSSSEHNLGRGYEWWLIEEAKRRNPNIQLIALAWNFPAWLKTANSQQTANYLVAFLEGALQKHGIAFDYVGDWPTAGTLATLGDPRWRDYRVAAQVLIDAPGYAALYGRISRATSDGVTVATHPARRPGRVCFAFDTGGMRSGSRRSRCAHGGARELSETAAAKGSPVRRRRLAALETAAQRGVPVPDRFRSIRSAPS